MSKSNNFLDAENSILENKLRFVKVRALVDCAR